MKRVIVRLRAQSPVAVGEWMTSRSNVRESLSYIPGGVLRGALAQAVQERLGGQHASRRALGGGNSALQDAFQTCFSKNGAQFGFLMPFTTQDWMPAPATSLFNKQHDHYLYDTLFALLRGEDYPMECPVTGDRLERGRGWLTRHNGTWAKGKLPPMRAFVRVGLNRQLETAEAGILYTLEAIEPTDADNQPVVSQGVLAFPDEACEQAFQTIISALRWGDGTVSLRIGSARTRGFGAVVLEMATEPLRPPTIDLASFAQHAGSPVFALVARTPAIVYDACGAPAQTLTPELLREYLPASVQLLPEATRVERMLVSGWSGAWGLPKPVQQAFAPGSVFTYQYAPADQAALQAGLQQLALHGIGERTAEGYGQFAICSSFHIDRDITQHTQTNTGGAR